MAEELKKRTPVEKFMLWGGVVALLLGLVLTALNILDKAYPNAPSIVANGESHPILLPPAPHASKAEEKAKEIVDTVMEFPDEIPEEHRYTIRQETSRMLAAVIENLQQERPYSSYYRFTVRNNGRKEATQVELELPVDGLFTIERADAKSEPLLFTKIVPVGALRPQSSLTVNVWSKHEISVLHAGDRFRVTHPEGNEGIQFQDSSARFFGVSGLSVVLVVVSCATAIVVTYMSWTLTSTTRRIVVRQGTMVYKASDDRANK